MCNGEYADMIVASFGRWKPINLEYGGMISTSNAELFEDIDDVFSTTNFYPCYDDLIIRLKKVRQRISLMLAFAEEVKKDIEKNFPDLKILHNDMRGLNVVIRFSNDEEKNQIEKYCESRLFEYVRCPKYIRVDEDAISIELKRLDIEGRQKR